MSGAWKRTVDAQGAVSNNLLDDTSLLKIGQTSAGNRSVDLHSVDENRDGDQAVGLDILVETIGSGLVEEDGVLGLVLNCTAGQYAIPSSIAQSSRTLPLRPLLLSLLWSGVCWSLAIRLVFGSLKLRQLALVCRSKKIYLGEWRRYSVAGISDRIVCVVIEDARLKARVDETRPRGIRRGTHHGSIAVQSC